MNTIYKKKRGGQLSLFNNACILFILIQSIACKCDNKPNDPNDSQGVVEGGGTSQTTQQAVETKPTLTLTGPAEVKNNPTVLAPTIITLELEVTDGTLNTDDYILEAIDLNNYENQDYTEEQLPENYSTKVSGTNRETLQTLTGTPTLTKNDKIDLRIPIVVDRWGTYDKGTINELTVPYSESAKFKFAILDKAGNPVAGPIEVKWTRNIT